MAKRKFRAEELEARAESNFIFEPVSSLWHCINPQLHLASAMVARALDEHCGAVNHALLLTGNSRLCRLQFKWKWLAT
jgi:hypothetical protein